MVSPLVSFSDPRNPRIPSLVDPAGGSSLAIFVVLACESLGRTGDPYPKGSPLTLTNNLVILLLSPLVGPFIAEGRVGDNSGLERAYMQYTKRALSFLIAVAVLLMSS